MFIRSLDTAEAEGYYVNWGAGTSHCLVVNDDNMGFTICHTIVWPYTESLLEYRNHLEACYCIKGKGEILIVITL